MARERLHRLHRLPILRLTLLNATIAKTAIVAASLPPPLLKHVHMGAHPAHLDDRGAWHRQWREREAGRAGRGSRHQQAVRRLQQQHQCRRETHVEVPSSCGRRVQ
jgi:hypothetical protein